MIPRIDPKNGIAFPVLRFFKGGELDRRFSVLGSFAVPFLIAGVRPGKLDLVVDHDDAFDVLFPTEKGLKLLGHAGKNSESQKIFSGTHHGITNTQTNKHIAALRNSIFS